MEELIIKEGSMSTATHRRYASMVAGRIDKAWRRALAVNQAAMAEKGQIARRNYFVYLSDILDELHKLVERVSETIRPDRRALLRFEMSRAVLGVVFKYGNAPDSLYPRLRPIVQPLMVMDEGAKRHTSAAA